VEGLSPFLLKTAPEIGLGRASPFTPVQAEKLLLKNSGNLGRTAKRL
jgi:hypothetical protein